MPPIRAVVPAAAAKQAGSSTVTLQAVAVTNAKLANFLTKQGFTETTVQVGKETVQALQKTIKIKQDTGN